MICKLDGGQAVTETATSGTFTLWAAAPQGSHLVSIQANGNTVTCSFNLGALSVISVSSICTSPLASCPP